MNKLAKVLRAETGYPWQDCIEASRRTTDREMARELLPVIHGQRMGSEAKDGI